MGSEYPGGEVIRCTEWSAAESLARFGPPGFGLGTPSPGLALGLAADRGGARCRTAAVLGWVEAAGLAPAAGPVLCLCSLSGCAVRIIFLLAQTVLIPVLLQPNNL